LVYNRGVIITIKIRTNKGILVKVGVHGKQMLTVYDVYTRSKACSKVEYPTELVSCNAWTFRPSDSTWYQSCEFNINVNYNSFTYITTGSDGTFKLTQQVYLPNNTDMLYSFFALKTSSDNTNPCQKSLLTIPPIQCV